MDDHILLVVAVIAGILNAVASLARTAWHYERRKAWKSGKPLTK